MDQVRLVSLCKLVCLCGVCCAEQIYVFSEWCVGLYKMKTALMVAEKPSLAASLASILSNGRSTSRKSINSACSVHEWNGNFRNESVRFLMTSVCGHVMTLDFISKYNNWDRVDPAELFSCPTEKKEAVPKLKMPALLGKEAKGCDYLILWLDCDKEGENICFEVMSAVSDSMRKDIKAAMNSLGKPNENEARSVDARQELDLRIGCAFTRFQTRFFQGKYGDLDASLISYGPCQTPTLGFCVLVQTADGRETCLEWERVRCFEKEVAMMFLALNTVELMRVASSGLGMGPHHAMQIAERLYTQGYISYPRTETTSYPENFDLHEVLRQQQHNSDWGAEVREILATGLNRPKKGKDAGDHPPITPMRPASRSELDGDAWRLYDYITRHFIATVSRDCTYLSTTVTFEIGSETFKSTGKTLLDPGFTSIMHWQAFSKNEVVPKFSEGDVVQIQEAKLQECQTCPPDYLTESELITLMEKHGIGTDASIPVHINNICQRNYVTVGSGRRLVPTTLGIVLVHGYQKEQLNLIAVGKASMSAVLQHTVEIFKQKFLYFVKNIEGMDQLFEVSFSPLAMSGKAMSRCGKCRRYMKYVQAKPSRLHCSHCDETYNLPQNGIIRIYKELKCPLDDFELLSWSAGNRGKSYPICPYCYNHQPFRDMKKGSGCNACTHPSCPHSLNSNGVSSCVECEGGVLVLDPASAPKWKLSCNRMTPGSRAPRGRGRGRSGRSGRGKARPKDKMAQLAAYFKHRAVTRPNRMTPGSRAPRGRGRGRSGRSGRGKARPKDKMAQLAAYFV
ncbi:hypothetical protein B566_EDAN001453 [Ephemera danica]|nr:hypothetical protein B566_EDAN001453 [Ephemera danica]